MADPTRISPDRERRLVELARRGDRPALGKLLDAHHRRVYHVCLRMVNDPDDAAELTQDALVRAIEKIDSFEGASRFGTWLMRIAMNLALSHLRRRHVRRTVSLDSPAPEPAGDAQAGPLKTLIPSGRELTAEQSVEKGEETARLHRALGELDVPLRSVIVLRDLQDLDYDQIADMLQVPLGTVKSRLFRARLALRKALADGEAPRTARTGAAKAGR